MKKSLKEKRQEANKTYFAGRTKEIEIFQQNLELGPDNEQFINLFNVYGVKGIGKTSLIKFYEELAKSDGYETIYINLSNTHFSPLNILEKITLELENKEYILHRFSKRYNYYLQIKERIAIENPPPHQSLLDILDAGVKHNPILSHNNTPSDVKEWLDSAQRRLAEEMQFTDTPLQELTPLWIEDIYKISAKKNIAIFLDDFEFATPEIEQWLLDVFRYEYGTFPTNFILTISARTPLSLNEWSEFSSLSKVVHLQPFTKEETKELLANKGITDDRSIENIFKSSIGSPVIVSAIASNQNSFKFGLDAVRLEEIFLGQFNSIEDPIKKSLILKGVVPRYLNSELVQFLSPDIENSSQFFNWATRKVFIEKKDHNIWHYHNLVRFFLIELQRKSSEKDFKKIHKQLSEYYHLKLIRLQKDKQRDEYFTDKEWLSHKLEQHYHALHIDFSEALPDFIYDFTTAIRLLKESDLLLFTKVIDEIPDDLKDKNWCEMLSTAVNSLLNNSSEGIKTLFEKINQTDWVKDDVDKACSLFQQSNYEEDEQKAVILLHKSIGYDPTHEPALLLLGSRLSKLGQPKEALIYYQQALNVNSNISSTYLKIGDLYAELNLQNKAIVNYEKAIRLDPSYSVAYNNMGIALHYQKKYEEAIEQYDQAIELSPSDLSIYQNKGKALRDIGKHMDAIFIFEESLNIDPNYIEAYKNIGNTYLDIINFEEAKINYTEALKLGGFQPSIYSNLGNALHGLKDYVGAISSIRRAIELDPKNSTYHANLGFVFSSIREFEEANKSFTKAIELNPNNAILYNRKGEALVQQGKQEEAINNFKTSIQLDEKSAEPYLEIVEIYLDQENSQKAIEVLKKAIEKIPKYAPHLYQRKIYLHLAEAEYEAAEATLQQARSNGISTTLLNELEYELKEQIEKQGGEKLYEAKIIVVGPGEAGKTTFIKKLVNPDHPVPDVDSQPTHGVDIYQHRFQKNINGKDTTIKANIWDFGGQQIFHDTHQFFLTPNALYVLVIDTRKDETPLGWWLHTISLFGKKSPIILIINQKSGFNYSVDETLLKKNFKQLQKIISVNFSDNTGIKGLEEAVQENLMQLELMGKELPKGWMTIRKKLQKEEEDYLSVGDFRKLCKKENIVSNEQLFPMCQQFHQLGVFLHYQEFPELEDLIIINPEWATKAAYDLITSKILEEQQGRFSFQDARDIWEATYPREKHLEIISLLKKFSLCYQIKGNHDYIIPQRLPSNAPSYNLPKDRPLKYQYYYPFMPKGVLSRFIVAVHTMVKEDFLWANGILLDKDDTIAEIKEDYFKSTISINVYGRKAKELLFLVREELFAIHNSYPDLAYQERLPCICSRCSRSGDFHFFPKEMIGLAKGKTKELQCGKSFEGVPIAAIEDNSIHLFNYDVHELKDLLAKNKLEKLFKAFRNDRLRKLIEDEVLSLSGRYNKLEEDKHKNVIKNEDYLLEYSRLIVACGSLIEKIERSSFKKEQDIE